MKKIFFSMILLFQLTLNAQSIYFCKSYTPKGEPIEAFNEWEISNNDGINLFILLKSNKVITGPLLYLFIDKYESGAYYPFDSKAIKMSRSKSWIAYNYHFSEEGRYAVYYQDTNQNQIADEIITITSTDKKLRLGRRGSSNYYEGCSLSFCDIVISGNPINIRRTTLLSGDSKIVYIYLNNNKPLNTSKILVHIWRKKNYSFSYDEFFDSRKYELQPEWNDTYFKYKFVEPGDYKFIIYNEDEVLITEGFFQVYQ